MSPDSTVDTELVIAAASADRPGPATAATPRAPWPRCTAWPSITVRLIAPPPLDTAMTVTRSEDALVASYDGARSPRAHPGRPRAGAGAAGDAATHGPPRRRTPVSTAHPFPTCFGCGTGREPGDGLRIFPGPVRGRARCAATWTPHPSVGADWHEDRYAERGSVTR